MTPEERFTKIENALQALVDTQSKHEANLVKQADGIRDLIVVSRTLIEGQRATDGTLNSLIEAQRATDDKLNLLISTVDQLANTVNAFVKSIQKPNGNQ